MKKVVITGGSGFIGKHISNALIQKNYEVTILTRNNKNKDLLLNNTIKFVQTDYSIESLQKILYDKDIIVHLAAKRLTGTIEDNKVSNFIKENISLSENLLIATINSNVTHFISTSSIGVYSSDDLMPFNEKSISTPSTSYGVSKLMMENLINYYCKKHNIINTILRLSQCYGLGEKESPVLMKFIKFAQEKKKIEVHNGGQFCLDEVYIKDVINAFIKVIEYQVKGTFNIGGGKTYSVKYIAETVNEIFNNPEKLEIQPVKTKLKIKKNYLNINKAKLSFKWEAKYSLEDGLNDMYNIIKKDKGNIDENS